MSQKRKRVSKTSWNPFSLTQWMAWLGATVTAVVVAVFSGMAYAHSTFVTVREHKITTEWLERVEGKLDRALSD